MLLNPSVKKLDLKQPYVWLATWFGAGMIGKAPGTVGSLAAIPCALAIYAWASLDVLLVSIFIVIVLGTWASKHFEKATGDQDNSMVVIDEVAGQWIALIPVLFMYGFSIFWIAVSFVMFRLFDIIKPWPISVIDKKVKGPIGVMADDIVAGIITAICIAGFSYA